MVDGGAGCLHFGITLYGNRKLKCWTAEGRKFELRQEPGTVWMSCSSSFRHQAEHEFCESTELLTFGVPPVV